jgi:hypothetical protein
MADPIQTDSRINPALSLPYLAGEKRNRKGRTMTRWLKPPFFALFVILCLLAGIAYGQRQPGRRGPVPTSQIVYHSPVTSGGSNQYEDGAVLWFLGTDSNLPPVNGDIRARGPGVIGVYSCVVVNGVCTVTVPVGVSCKTQADGICNPVDVTRKYQIPVAVIAPQKPIPPNRQPGRRGTPPVVAQSAAVKVEPPPACDEPCRAWSGNRSWIGNSNDPVEIAAAATAYRNSQHAMDGPLRAYGLKKWRQDNGVSDACDDACTVRLTTMAKMTLVKAGAGQ